MNKFLYIYIFIEFIQLNIKNNQLPYAVIRIELYTLCRISEL